ncbi:hypothetical protein [Thermospira aquatica]|uniref:Lipoprotein n=1 Tax=Thermospira aquatica TaxID=2828656 RepID=A0AAX3BDS3_9SPIR|nr:hypothetical protein [Thermospira aquatica]URA10429.1 hypothetical protein KDW03_01095 [Thermospira aquatica]
MKNILWIFFLVLLTGCAKTIKPAPEPPKKDNGYVIFVSRGGEGEWQLVDSEGKRLVPTNLSPALKVHNLRVYFSYEELFRREDGTIVVRITNISIE